MYSFWLVRDEDVTGVSGTGVVAEGVIFNDGNVALRWYEVKGEHYDRGVRATTVLFPNVRACWALHGHNGATHLDFGIPVEQLPESMRYLVHAPKIDALPLGE